MGFLRVTVLLTFLVLVSSDGNIEICSTPEQTPGKCIQIRYCPPLLNILIRKPVSQLDIEYLEKNNCGFEGIHPKVCCSLDDCLEPPKVDLVVLNSTSTKNDSILPLEDECGFTNEDRIYNRVETQLDTFSWTALLQYRTAQGLKFHCGGVLISKRYVLTAANCVSDKSIDSSWSLTSVRLGEYNLSQDPDFEEIVNDIYYIDSALNVLIEKVIVHPQYNTETLAHDIALLRLAEDIKLSDHIAPICLENSSRNVVDLISGRSSIVCGWNSNKDNEPTENVKRKTIMTIEDNKKCGLSFIDNGIHLTDQLCAKPSHDTDSYYGDTGGALLGFSTRGQHYAIGIMSVRSINGLSNNTAVIYSNVKEHIPWIIETLEP